jgi:uncharacterized repeat protein (TIGR02543 family)
VVASVRDYTSDYTRLCITAAFTGTQQFGVELVIPGKGKQSETYQDVRLAEQALSKHSTRNADGSYTFDISLSKYADIKANGISTIMLYLDPEVNVSGTRSMTILDIGFRKDGEPAYQGGEAPTQGISLSESGTYSFPDTTAGYGSQTAKSVTVTNTGSAATGSLSVKLAGDNASAFTLSKTSISSISTGRNDSFTVKPNTGLSAGTYTATVTVSNANVSESFDVSFTVASKLYSVTVNGSYATPDGSGSYAEGDTVTVLAGSRSGYTFDKWTTTTSGVNFANAGSATTTFIMPARNVTVTAAWVADTSQYGISLNPDGAYSFPDANAGYGAQAAKTVTVTNTGSTATGNLTVALSGDNPDVFTLSKKTVSGINVGRNDTFTVKPNTGLAAGTYTATVQVSNANVSAQLGVSFTVKAAEEEPVTGRPVIGEFKNHKDNERNRFTFEIASGQTTISYKTNTNWDIAEASVSGYTYDYTRLCITAKFVGTQQFGIEAKVPGMSSAQELRNAEIALNKSDDKDVKVTLNADGSYTYDITLSSTIRSKGISALYFFLDPAANVSGTRSMTILDIGFRKDGEPAR